MTPSILIVEDQADINHLLSSLLKEAGYTVLQAFSGSEALLLLEKKIPDLLLLDLILPGVSGEELLETVRNQKQYAFPIIILSAKSNLYSKVALLKMGADDYITKPFETEELLARIEAQLRKKAPSFYNQETLLYKNIRLLAASRQVFVKDTEIFFTVHEYDLLYLLMREPQKVFSREKLYEIIWKDGYYGENNTVNVHISNIRKKLRKIDSKCDYIQTVYGIGFRLG